MIGFKYWLLIVIMLPLLSACGSGASSPSISTVPIVEVPPVVEEPEEPEEPEVPVYEPVAIVQPKQLCIYYGQPDLINATKPVYLRDETGTIFDVQVSAAVVEFSRCALVVLGDGLEIPTNPAYYNTQLVIYGLAEKGIPIFGYVDAGVSTQNLSLAAAQERIAQWKAMGVNGVFLDDFGFDFGVTRTRQNEFLNLVHQQGLQAFVNAFNPDDVFADQNEQGVIQLPQIVADDLYLAENWLYETGRLTNPELWFNKSSKLSAYLQRYGVRLAATATTAAMQATEYDYTKDVWQYAYFGVLLQGAEFFQWTDNGFSSDDNQLYTYVIDPGFLLNTFFTSDIKYSLESSGIKSYTRTYTNGTIGIYGDGVSSMGIKLAN